MNLLTLNIWCGEVYLPLIDFLQKQSLRQDVFCFQEVFNYDSPEQIPIHATVGRWNIYSDLKKCLPDFTSVFYPAIGQYGLAIFIRKTLSILDTGSLIVHEGPSQNEIAINNQRILAYAKVEHNDKVYTIVNLHGLWNGGGKTDTPERILQSQNTKKFLESCEGARILCGDFNLLPDTQSLQILEEGMSNWVKIKKVTSTRSSLYTKEQKFADYILTSPELEVKSFQVLPDEISDHLALTIDCE